MWTSIFHLSVCRRSYMRTMRHKLGLLQLEHDSDEQLVQDLLQVRYCGMRDCSFSGALTAF